MLGAYQTYFDAILKAGGTPIVLPPDPEEAARWTRMLDGLLLTGGGDIHPKFFRGKKIRKKLRPSPDERTKFELKMVQEALKKNLPTLGICLGCQTISVACGGTLIQDLPSERPATRDHDKGVHRIDLDPRSVLQRILGRSQVRVNSRHHQAIDSPGKGVRVSARSADQVIEAIEVSKKRFFVGVQWHPEIMPKDIASKKIFRAFVDACKKK